MQTFQLALFIENINLNFKSKTDIIFSDVQYIKVFVVSALDIFWHGRGFVSSFYAQLEGYFVHTVQRKTAIMENTNHSVRFIYLFPLCEKEWDQWSRGHIAYDSNWSNCIYQLINKSN